MDGFNPNPIQNSTLDTLALIILAIDCQFVEQIVVPLNPLQTIG